MRIGQMKHLPGILFAALAATTSSSTFADVVSDMGSIPDQAAEQNDKDWTGLVGLVALSAPEYWGSDETESSGAPVIIVDYKDTAYFKVNRGGFWFWKPNDNLRVGALVKLRPGAWEDDDDSIEDLSLPASFDEPDAQAEPGVNLRYKSGKFAFEAQALSGEDTNLALTFDYHLIRSKQTTLTVRLGMESLGEDTVRYNWYGDNDSFDVDSASNTSLGLIGTYSLNPEWKLIYGLQSTMLDEEIEDSPIGDEDTYNIGFVGAGWAF